VQRLARLRAPHFNQNSMDLWINLEKKDKMLFVKDFLPEKLP
jgi:hypothetical protein